MLVVAEMVHVMPPGWRPAVAGAPAHPMAKKIFPRTLQSIE